MSNDMDVGIFYEDLLASQQTDEDIVSTMKNQFHFTFRHRYGQINHGLELTLICPQQNINIDVFVFYRLNESDIWSDYYAATYNGLCDRMQYEKCRWKFTEFELDTFEMRGKQFRIVPESFIVERYGENYTIPKQYNYFESLEFLPNLIPE